MFPAEIHKLRKELSCTARELAATLGVEHKDVVAWESGERFPTKRHVEALRALAEKGPSAIVRVGRARASASQQKVGLARLSDPAFWRVVRKLVEHPTLFEDVAKLSEKYPDPEDSGR